MDYLSAIVLALLQGITEFLPVSSSAHLILLPRLLGWTDQGLIFDVAVHLGTLAAVVWYFHDEIRAVIIGWLRALAGRPHDARDAQLGWDILVGSVPLVITGFLAEDLVSDELRSALVIALTTAVFGVLLWVADLKKHPVRDEHDVGLWPAFTIGCAQVLALIPGTSRSGITMTAGLALGLSRETASRFSFLLAIPAIAGASVLEIAELVSAPSPIEWRFLITGLIVSALSAYLCIRLFLAFIRRIGMFPFMVYRLALAALIAVVLL